MNSGGAERVASTLANAWVSRGDQVTLMPTFSGGGECFYKLSPDVRLVFLADLVSSRARTFVNQLARLRALRRFIVTERPEMSLFRFYLTLMWPPLLLL
jgi:GalNAc-alpha-(1->4)-GalNAc-alpha-(1->3)-diNAcBac-PP-undecaprenol alpha-1,4-N-acetyl-D-galactosaminyltransferase